MTEESEQTHNLNCTQCGAGLDVLGGGRVKAHICSYCGAELDAQDDYKVIKQFRDMRRPETPFDLGMKGELWGVEFTIIGTIAWNEYYDGRSWIWVDHQIFSPTHGYAWLTVENGHVTYVRKSREQPNPAVVTEYQVENSDNRPSVRYKGKTYRYYGSGKASPTFIEGSFNFRPDMDDSIRYVSLMGGAQMLDIVESRSEREYEVSVLPDRAALLDSFGVEPQRRPNPRSLHPLDVLERSPMQLFVRNLALLSMVVSILLGIVMLFKGSEVANSNQKNINRELVLPFEITNGTGLTEIEIRANSLNSWAWFEAELTDKDGEPVAAFEDGVEYYKGSDWTEGSQKARTRMKLEPGKYTLYVNKTESEVDWTGGREATAVSVSVYQGAATSFWMWILATGFGAVAFYFLGQRSIRYARRWSGSDWSDD